MRQGESSGISFVFSGLDVDESLKILSLTACSVRFFESMCVNSVLKFAIFGVGFQSIF